MHPRTLWLSPSFQRWREDFFPPPLFLFLSFLHHAFPRKVSKYVGRFVDRPYDGIAFSLLPSSWSITSWLGSPTRCDSFFVLFSFLCVLTLTQFYRSSVLSNVSASHRRTRVPKFSTKRKRLRRMKFTHSWKLLLPLLLL